MSLVLFPSSMADVVEQYLTLPSYKCFRASPTTMAASASCCRDLFGRPDPDELRRDLQMHRDRLHRQSVERWNFDFESGHPLSGGRYAWQLDAAAAAGAAATREPTSCVGLPTREEDDDDDQTPGAERLEPIQIPSNSDGATTPPARRHGIPSSTDSSADVPVCPVPPRRKRGRDKSRDAGTAKQRRASTGRRTVARRQAKLVHSAGAARVTGKFDHLSLRPREGGADTRGLPVRTHISGGASFPPRTGNRPPGAEGIWGTIVPSGVQDQEADIIPP